MQSTSVSHAAPTVAFRGRGRCIRACARSSIDSVGQTICLSLGVNFRDNPGVHYLSQGELCYRPGFTALEALSPWYGDHYPFKPSATPVFSFAIQVGGSQDGEVDGLSAVVSHSHQVYEGEHKHSGRFLQSATSSCLDTGARLFLLWSSRVIDLVCDRQ